MQLNIKKILVPIDFSEVSMDALRYAANLAHKTEAEILLLHIVESYEFNTGLEEVVEYNNVLDEKIKKKLEDIRTHNTELWGIRMKTKLAKGKIHIKVKETADQEDVDLIVMGTTGASSSGGFGRFFLGSNTHRLIRISDVPVITLREGHKFNEFKKIILPLDFQKETTQKVNSAIKLAKVFNSEVHVVAVAEFFEEFANSLDTLKVNAEKVASEFYEQGVSVKIATLRNKSAADAVMGYAQQEEADITVIMARAENRINEFMLGSSARKIILESQRPVLSFRPK